MNEEKLGIIRKYCESVNDELAETYFRMVGLYGYRPYLSDDLFSVLESELEQAYENIVCENIFELKEKIFDAVHELVDSMTEGLSLEDAAYIRQQLTEQFKF